MTTEKVVWFFVCILLKCVNPQQQVCVKENGSGEILPCKLPFRFSGQIFNACTTASDPEGKPWCSTRTSGPENDHVGGGRHWGHCDENITCSSPLEQEITNYLETFDRRVMFDSRCQCQSYRNCNWSKKLLTYYSTIGRNHELAKSIADLLRAGKCSNQQGAHCCESGISSTPTTTKTTTQRPTTTTTTTQRPTTTTSTTSTPTRPTTPVKKDDDNWLLGTWKPRKSFECGTRTKSENIVGGELANLGEFPYMALLGYTNKKDGEVYYLCGGSVINNWYVLTAAHCVVDDVPSEVILGEHEVGEEIDCNAQGEFPSCNPPSMTRKVTKVIIHENYDRVTKVGPYDIALLRLDKRIVSYLENETDSAVMPVCLPWSRNDPGRVLRANDKLIVTGWGRVTNNKRLSNKNYLDFRAATRILMRLVVPGISRSKCADNPAFPALNTDLQICAGAEAGKDSCNGDSGGPLVYSKFTDEPYYQVGVVSFGTSICGIGVPGIYTRIVPFLPWIDQNLEP